MKTPARIAVYPKDVCIITGKSISYGRRVLAAIRELHNKQSHQIVTFNELFDYLGLSPDQLKQLPD